MGKLVILVIVVIVLAAALATGAKNRRAQELAGKEQQQRVLKNAITKEQWERDTHARWLNENAPERERIARDFPDDWRAIGQKMGQDLSNCLVTESQGFISADCRRP